MASNDITQAVLARGTLFYGTAGSTAATAVGYLDRDAGLGFTGALSNIVEYFVDTLDGPAILQESKIDANVKGSLVQFTPEIVGVCLGVDAVGQRITIGGTAYATREFSVKLTVQRRDAVVVTIEIPYAFSMGGLDTLLSREGVSLLPFDFRAIDKDAGMYTVDIDNANVTATLVTGVLTRIISEGYHLVAGEGDAADVLTSITAGDLVDNETLRLQIADVDNPITLTHLNGTLELFGDVDWVMTDVNDYIDLQYDLAGTKWDELGRFDDSGI